LSFVVLLPDARDGLGAIEEKLSEPELARWLATIPRASVEVTLPRFKLETEVGLVETLKKLGMALAFGDGADFSGIAEGKPLAVSSAIHKAFVAVDEEGTEAAAATTLGIEPTAAHLPPVVRCDHPFLFFIRDVHTSRILFMGRLISP
jgi:serpin B